MINQVELVVERTIYLIETILNVVHRKFQVIEENENKFSISIIR